MNSPLLSVIIPVLDGKFLPEAVASIQRYPGSVEIIIVDDGSTDDTAAYAQSLGESPIYIRQETAGPAAARNRGLEAAHGEWIGFLDADDLWAPNHPARAISYLQEHPEVDLALGQVRFLTESSRTDSSYGPSGEPFHSYQLGAAIARRRLLDRIGGFNSAMRYGEDVDWFLRARESGAALGTLSEVALYYRLHPGNRANVHRTSRAGLLDAFHHAIQRKRSVPPFGTSEKKRPLVSVIMPVFNGEAFIADAIRSVFAQDYRPLELIVVDDGSTDRTSEVVRNFPQVVLQIQRHQGPGAARNAGIRAAHGEMIAFLDADDLWVPGKLSRQMEILAANHELEAVFAHVETFREGRADGGKAALPGALPATMLIKHQAFERIGWFNEEPRALEGVDWYLHALEKSLRAHMLPEVFYRRRIHGKNRTIVNRDLNGYIRALKASLDRRRDANKTGPHAERS